MIQLQVDGEERTLDPEVLVVAGYTGADVAAVEHHIAELADQGVPRPPQVPMYWAMSPTSLTQDSVVSISGPRTSGEIELVLVVDRDEVLITAGSDHTDRDAETIDIGLSKSTCVTPIGRHAWPWAAVRERWADLRLGSEIVDVAGNRACYQNDLAGVNRHPDDLLAGIPWSGARPDCFVLLCGTVTCQGGIRPADRFIGTVADPVTDQVITVDYRIEVIPQLATAAPVSNELAPPR